MTALRDRLGHCTLLTRMALTGATAWPRVMAAAGNPVETQERTLRRILHANRETEFGRAHSFAAMAAVEDYRKAVPIADYEAYRPGIERQLATGRQVFVAEEAVMVAQTSGTTAKPKSLLVTRQTLARAKAMQALFGYGIHRGSRFFDGRIVAISGASREGTLPNGTPIGAISGVIHDSMPAAVRRKYVLPGALAEIPDYDLRQRLVALLCSASDDVTGVVTANPSTILRIETVLNERLDDILSNLESGGETMLREVPTSLRDRIAASLRPAPRRASSLARLAMRASNLTLGDIWPGLAAISTWTGGSCGIAVETLRPSLPTATRILELGYVASEFRGTLTADSDRGLGLPTLWENHFEFAERTAWEAGGAELLQLHEIEEGRQYYVFVTTPDGLYRYDINDVVEVVGRIGQTPALAFVRKGKGVTNITGEKLSEEQLRKAATSSLAQCGAASPFFLALADEAASLYRLFVEAPRHGEMQADRLAATVDAALCELNIEYRSKRASGRLAPLRCTILVPGAGEQYRRHLVRRGQRDAQFKPALLRYQRDTDFAFDRLSVQGAD